MSVNTVPELFLSAVHNTPRPDCFSYRDENGDYIDISSEETLLRVRSLRYALKTLGVGIGDRVAILAENRFEWVLSDLAALSIGAVTVPIYATLLAETIEFILRDAEPVVLFVSTEEQAAKIHPLRGTLPFLKDVISYDHTALPDVLTFSRLLEIGQNLINEHPPTLQDDCPEIDRNSPCSIIYTSGTTGAPKGVVLSHWNFVSNVLTIRDMFPFRHDDKCLSFLPLSHVLERMAGYYTMLYAGVGISFAQRMDTVPVDILDVQPTIIVSVPRLYEKIFGKAAALAMGAGFPKKNLFFWARDIGMLCADLAQQNKQPGRLLAFKNRLADAIVYTKIRAKLGGKIRFMVSGGAPLSPRINRFFYGAGLRIMEGYGLTETSPVLSCNTMTEFRFGSVGKVLHGTEVKIADDGEILARGPQIMPGYYNNDTATSEVIDKDGWLATGDIGYFDADQYLYITDRKKDIIVTAGGKNIAPQPIENKLSANKYVTQVVVIGDRRQYLSALIVPNFELLHDFATEFGLVYSSDNNLIDLQEVKDLFDDLLTKANKDMPGFSQIKKCALLDREFSLEAGELTPTMKIKRFAISRKHADLINQMYPESMYEEDN